MAKKKKNVFRKQEIKSTYFNYNKVKDNGSQITNYILVADATFDLDEIVENDLLSITIITPQQRLSVGFNRDNVEGGHSNMTEMMLARIKVGFEDDGKGLEVYSNNPENIYLTIEPSLRYIIARIPDRISRKQINLLKEYISEAMKSKAVQQKKLTIGVLGEKECYLSDFINKMQDRIGPVDMKPEYQVEQFKNKCGKNQSIEQLLKSAERYSSLWGLPQRPKPPIPDRLNKKTKKQNKNSTKKDKNNTKKTAGKNDYDKHDGHDEH